jgi:FAD/FMN-containing dehydrogenase
MSTVPSTADWTALDRAIAGEVVLPASDDYEAARRPAMARFCDIRPQAVVRCRTPQDVAEALALTRRWDIPATARSGGHCFAGCSSTTGVVLDVGPMNAATVADDRVTVGAGVRLGELYDVLDERARTIAGGCGPSVGIAGLTLGGGLGILGRRHGLTSDQLLAAEVVLADGRVVDCDEDHHTDLFWALRGAGGLRFGVVTRLVLRTLPAPDATALELRWPPEAAAKVVEGWQHWAPGAPDEVAANLFVTAGADPDRPIDVRAFGAALGSERDVRRKLDGLVTRARVDPVSTTLEHRPYRQTKRWLAEHDEGSTAKPEPGHLYAKSEFFRAPLSARTIAALVKHIGADRVPGQARELDFTPWGGAYNRVPADATAFVHRAERFLLKHEVVIAAEQSHALTPPARDWLRRSWALAHPSAAGGAYSNFPDPDLDAWDRAYHGANLDRLLRVKRHYDPHDIFRAL